MYIWFREVVSARKVEKEEAERIERAAAVAEVTVQAAPGVGKYCKLFEMGMPLNQVLYLNYHYVH